MEYFYNITTKCKKLGILLENNVEISTRVFSGSLISFSSCGIGKLAVPVQMSILLNNNVVFLVF